MLKGSVDNQNPQKRQWHSFCALCAGAVHITVRLLIKGVGTEPNMAAVMGHRPCCEHMQITVSAAGFYFKSIVPRSLSVPFETCLWQALVLGVWREVVMGCWGGWVCVKVPLQQESYKPLKKRGVCLKRNSSSLGRPRVNDAQLKITCFNIRPNKMWTFMCVCGGGVSVWICLKLR